MGDILISGPTTEPVTVAELRSHLRDVADPDPTLLRLLKAAREYVEEATGLALAQQTRELTLDGWPAAGDGLGWWDGVQDGALLGTAARYLELPKTPLRSIVSVTTYDDANNPAEWNASQYFADTGSRPGRLALNNGAVWPVTTRPAAGIAIRYTAGYAECPAVLCMAVLQIAAHWYENRELVDYDGPQRLPMQAERIITKMRVVKL